MVPTLTPTAAGADELPEPPERGVRLPIKAVPALCGRGRGSTGLRQLAGGQGQGRGRKEARPPHPLGCGQNAETEGLLCMKSLSLLLGALAAPGNSNALAPSLPPFTYPLTPRH